MRIEIACNDPDNGIFDGKARAIFVGNVEFFCRSWDWSPRLTEGDGWIRLGGKKLRCGGSKTWGGNWCWNVYWCDEADVEALVNWPKFRKWYDIEQGPERIFDKYRAGKPLKLKKKVPNGAT